MQDIGLRATTTQTLTLLVAALLSTAAGVLLFLDVIRTDDLMFYVSPERGKIAGNEADIERLEANIRDIEEDLHKVQEAQHDERRILLKAIDAKRKLIVELREENRKLKWTGVVGFHTILDKIPGFLIALLGISTGYMALKLKRIELKQVNKENSGPRIIRP